MIKLYCAPKTRSARAIWMLEEVGVGYAKEIVDIRSPEREDSAEFRRASPMGKVPALADGELAMSESGCVDRSRMSKGIGLVRLVEEVVR